MVGWRPIFWSVLTRALGMGMYGMGFRRFRGYGMGYPGMYGGYPGMMPGYGIGGYGMGFPFYG